MAYSKENKCPVAHFADMLKQDEKFKSVSWASIAYIFEEGMKFERHRILKRYLAGTEFVEDNYIKEIIAKMKKLGITI